MCWDLGVGGLAPSINVVPSPTCMEQNIKKKKKIHISRLSQIFPLKLSLPKKNKL